MDIEKSKIDLIDRYLFVFFALTNFCFCLPCHQFQLNIVRVVSNKIAAVRTPCEIQLFASTESRQILNRFPLSFILSM